MDSASILKYIKPKIKEALKIDARCQKALARGNLERENAGVQELQQLLQEIKDWLEPVLGTSQEEVCSLLDEKSTGGPLLPLSTDEPVHPEVVIALGLFTVNQLSEFLSSACLEQYKRMRGGVRHLKSIE